MQNRAASIVHLRAINAPSSSRMDLCYIQTCRRETVGPLGRPEVPLKRHSRHVRIPVGTPSQARLQPFQDEDNLLSLTKAEEIEHLESFNCALSGRSIEAREVGEE